MNGQFKQWFDDMEERYQASYGSYEQLLQEAFEAGAKQEREACAAVCWKNETDNVFVNSYDGKRLDLLCAEQIRARGQA